MDSFSLLAYACAACGFWFIIAHDISGFRFATAEHGLLSSAQVLTVCLAKRACLPPLRSHKPGIYFCLRYRHCCAVGWRCLPSRDMRLLGLPRAFTVCAAHYHFFVSRVFPRLTAAVLHSVHSGAVARRSERMEQHAWWRFLWFILPVWILVGIYGDAAFSPRISFIFAAGFPRLHLLWRKPSVNAAAVHITLMYPCRVSVAPPFT